jgi:DNA-nicking Smr family endonuclease
VPLDHLEEEEEDFDRLSSSEIETGDFLSFCRPGLQKRVFQELERGKIRFEWEVDLHGLTVDFARAELGRFLRHCAGQRVRCALIIHGKGLRSEERQPVLKQMTNLWLRQREEVLAFCSAVRRDGGTGATYVLLRRSEGKGRRRRG